MPTFETPVAPLEHSKFVEQIPLDTLFKGMGYKQTEYDQNFQQMQGQIDAQASSAARAYGPDKAAADQVTAAINSQIEGLAKSNLLDSGTKMGFNHLISSASQAMLPIARRTAQIEAMQEAKKAADLKGQTYYNKDWNRAMQYTNSNQYDAEASFSNPGGIAPDLGKIDKEVKDGMEFTEKVTKNPDGTETKVKQYDPKEVERRTMDYLKAHGGDDYVDYLWENQTSGMKNEDWLNLPNQVTQTAQEVMNNEQKWLNSNPGAVPQERELHQRNLNFAASKYKTYNDLLMTQQPNLIASAKATSRNEAMAEWLKSHSAGTSAIQESLPVLAELKKLAIQNQNAITQSKYSAAYNEAAVTGQMSFDDKGGVSITPGNIPAKPSGRQVTIPGKEGMYGADDVVITIESAFNPSDAVSATNMEWVKGIIMGKDPIGKRMPTENGRIFRNADGTLHVYVVGDANIPPSANPLAKNDDNTFVDSNVERDLGSFSKSAIYADLGSSLQKEVAAHRRSVIGTWPKASVKGVQVPIAPSEKEGKEVVPKGLPFAVQLGVDSVQIYPNK